MILGIILGLAAATCQSGSYLFTRRFVVNHGPGASVSVLVLGHLIMGGLSVVALPFLWYRTISPVSVFAPTLAAVSGFYLIGQGALTVALRSAEASRLAPLLGLKILVVALLSIFFLGNVLVPLQWLAVALSLSGAFLLSRVGGAIAPRAVAGTLVACVGYSLSDVSITRLVTFFQNDNSGAGVSLLHATALGVCLSYVVCGVVALIALPVCRHRSLRHVAQATPYALFWYAGMFFLFAAFAHSGVVFGNIVQSTRGLISIVAGALLARRGFVHLEESQPRAVLLRRGAAALLMMAAIALFTLATRR